MSEEKYAGIVAEFNPFHNGHALLIKRARELGFSGIAVVMSGNYTQRGEGAIMLKSARAKAALSCGADLCLELPIPFAISSAKNFAFGAVSILDSLGILDSLVFGSECGSTEKLSLCCEKLLSPEYKDKLSENLKLGFSFPKALSLSLTDEFKDILSNPNDTLATQYILALRELNSDIKPLALKREGAAHDGKVCPQNSTASASKIREMIYSGDFENASKYLPKKSAEIITAEIDSKSAPFSHETASLLMLERFRRLTKDDFLNLPDVSEGLENRLYSAARTSNSLENFCFSVKSKRYTLSRIRRIALCAYLGIDKSLTLSAPPYVRVLGFNDAGKRMLAEAKKSAKLPIVSRCADFKSLDALSNRFFELECRASDLYCLALPKIKECGLEQKFKIIRNTD